MVQIITALRRGESPPPRFMRDIRPATHLKLCLLYTMRETVPHMTLRWLRVRASGWQM